VKLGGDDYQNEMVRICEHYLTGTGSVLYGQYWDVSDDKQRREAATWLAEQVDGVAALVVGQRVQRAVPAKATPRKKPSSNGHGPK